MRVMSIHPERTFGRLRYSLGGDRPSQTTHLALSVCRITVRHEIQTTARVVFHCCLPAPRKERIVGSHLCYAALDRIQWQAVVKLHGVFLSCYGFTAS